MFNYTGIKGIFDDFNRRIVMDGLQGLLLSLRCLLGTFHGQCRACLSGISEYQFKLLPQFF